jgi:hypothetical protein
MILRICQDHANSQCGYGSDADCDLFSSCHSFIAVTGQVDGYRGGFESGVLRLSGSGVLEEDGDEVSIFPVTTEEKRNVEVQMKKYSEEHPVVGGIYRDKSGSSLVVVNVVGDKVLLEYANGTVTRVDASNWQQLKPQIAVY